MPNSVIYALNGVPYVFAPHPVHGFVLRKALLGEIDKGQFLRKSSQEYRYEDDLKHPSEIFNPIPRHLSTEEKVNHLARLTQENLPIIQSITDHISSQLGIPAKANIKTRDSIIAKAKRPSILQEKPWHDVEHIRDSLRFKASLDHFDQIEYIARLLSDKGMKPVKVDTAKMFRPKQWGWRMAAFDLRMPNGQLVEHYTPLSELEAVKGTNHKLFEKWRGLHPNEIERRKDEYLKDIDESVNRYQSAFDSALKRMGFNSQEQAEEYWNNTVNKIHQHFSRLF